MESPKKTNIRLSKPDDIPEGENKSFTKHYSLVFELIIMNLILIVGGYYLDKYLSSSPVMILITTFLSIGATIRLLLKSLK